MSIVRELRKWEDSGWCAEGWVPNRRAMFAMRALERFQRWQAAWFCIRPPVIEWGSRRPDILRYPLGERAFLRVKAAICLVLDLEPQERPWAQCDVDVVYFDADLDYCDWKEVWVSSGYFSNWCARVVREFSE